MPVYSLISNPYRLSTHCGLAIIISVHENFSYERKLVFENLSTQICLYDSTYNKYLISTVYRPPKPLIEEDLMTFIDNFPSFLRETRTLIIKLLSMNTIENETNLLIEVEPVNQHTLEKKEKCVQSTKYIF